MNLNFKSRTYEDIVPFGFFDGTVFSFLFYVAGIFAGLFFGTNIAQCQDYSPLKDSLQVHFKGDASIEVGSPYAGLEFHHSSPLAQRISFYYPVANSIDLSNDYWTRDEDYSMVLGLKIGTAEKEWIGFEPFEYTMTPYEVSFHKKDGEKEIEISYQFSKDSPVFITTYKLKNTGPQTQQFEFYTNIEASLKTSHTYATKDKAWSEFDGKGSSLFINYEEPETQNVQLFSLNAGLQPDSYSALSSLDSLPAPKSWWKSIDWNLQNQVASKQNQQTPAFRYVYGKELAPGDSMIIIQITGSAQAGEGKEMAGRLLTSYQKEITDYEAHILESVQKNVFKTGDPVLDKSVKWSHAILGANMHYIDGSIQPMPCPAEYNFYFTHDVLLTDLAAVNFDLPRVKKDLEFIIAHADSNFIIPHAYYWKDLDYATEIAPPDNWNHFWFVITAGSYLRHSGDEVFAEKLYPYLAKSVEEFQKHKKENIIYSYRPDWWDIARNFGPRSYTTILATKALREFIFISNVLEKNEEHLLEWEEDAHAMQTALNEKLWSKDQNYLINYFEDGSLDEHYYIGSLLGSHYDLLIPERKEKLAETAAQKILDPEIGVFTVYPMDFQNLIEYLKLSGNEAGDPHYYINGGIWPHGNAWYALSLIEIERREEALSFIKNVMTLDGAINSPNGQPAMYEYRVSKKDDPAVYGKIDKPQFTWAAGWYLYSLYNLYGVKETEWNIRFEPYLPKGLEQAKFVLTSGGQKIMVGISGNGNHVESIHYDENQVYSKVMPYNFHSEIKHIKIKKGRLKSPLLTNVNAIVEAVNYDEEKREMIAKVKSYPGHEVTAIFDSPYQVEKILINGIKTEKWSSGKKGDYYQIKTEFRQLQKTDEITIYFKHD